MRIVMLVLAVLALAVAAPAVADKGGNPNGGGNSGEEKGNKGGGGKGGGGGGMHTSSLSLILLESSDGLPHFGQKITFSVSTTATDYPWVTLECVRGGALVYRASKGIFATSLGQDFTLGPTPSWQGGDADCSAYLENWDSYSKNGKIQTLASLDLHVYA